jgi:hypothetical protein
MFISQTDIITNSQSHARFILWNLINYGKEIHNQYDHRLFRLVFILPRRSLKALLHYGLCNLSRNFVATQVVRTKKSVARSRIRFYFSQQLRQRCMKDSAWCNIACNAMLKVIYEQRERVFHRDIQTRENNVWKHEREAWVFSYIAFSCLDIPVRHELELFIWLLKWIET